MTRILLVDDHPIVRHGIKQVLAGAFDPAVVGEASSAEEGLSKVRDDEWDVMILDLTLPGSSGLELLKDLRREQPMLPVIILSMHPAEQFARRAMTAGAYGYLTKDGPPDELIEAIGHAVSGERYMNPTGVETVESGWEPPHEALSDREYQVLRMLASGLTVSQIAQRLSLSPKTIGTFRARIRAKMGLRTTAEMVHYAIQHRLVD